MYIYSCDVYIVSAIIKELQVTHILFDLVLKGDHS